MTKEFQKEEPLVPIRASLLISMIASISSRVDNTAKAKPLGPQAEQIPPKVARASKRTMAANAKIALARTVAWAGVQMEAGLGHKIEY